ncbi:MAG TPA: FHA domain-containing protein [Thermoflexia bacterium]|nr:FHA domain-containing protein [Thermoflexia bacterium]
MDILLLALRLLLVILLYVFLVMVLLMLWRDLRQATASRETARPGGRLVVLHTEDKALAVGIAFPLQPVTSIGRSPSNTIFIPDAYASARHALLTWREGQWWLEDQGSRNGTLLNGIRISGPTVVSAGDIIGVGRTQLKLELE